MSKYQDKCLLTFIQLYEIAKLFSTSYELIFDKVALTKILCLFSTKMYSVFSKKNNNDTKAMEITINKMIFRTRAFSFESRIVFLITRRRSNSPLTFWLHRPIFRSQSSDSYTLSESVPARSKLLQFVGSCPLNSSSEF